MKNKRSIFMLVVTLIAVVAVGLAHAHGVVPPHAGPLDLVPLVPGFALVGSVNDSVAQDNSSYFSTDTVRAMLDAAIKDYAYGLLNRPAWQVAAAAVAPPVCATATVTSQVKTTATTQLYIDGVPLSLAATDNLWTLTGGNLAAGSVRKYALLWDGTTNATVVTVLASNDVVIATSPLGTAASALAQCRFPSLPPKNATGGSNVIVGILSVTNTTNPFIPGTTLLGAAGVTAAYRDGPDVNIFQASLVTP